MPSEGIKEFERLTGNHRFRMPAKYGGICYGYLDNVLKEWKEKMRNKSHLLMVVPLERSNGKYHKCKFLFG